MWLVIQIAAGIVLGWLIITRWEQLKKITVGGFAILLVIAAMALIGWGGSEAWHYTTGLSSHTLLKWAGTAVLVVLVLSCCIGTGLLIFMGVEGFTGKSGISDEFLTDVQHKERTNVRTFIGMLLGFVNVFITGALVAALTGEQTLPFLGVWSRDNGFKDLGEMMSGALVGQWPWVVVLSIWYWKHRPDRGHSSVIVGEHDE